MQEQLLASLVSLVIGIVVGNVTGGLLKKLGVKFLGPVLQEDTSRVVYFADTDGNEFYLIELSSDWSKYAPESSAA